MLYEINLFPNSSILKLSPPYLFMYSLKYSFINTELMAADVQVRNYLHVGSHAQSQIHMPLTPSANLRMIPPQEGGWIILSWGARLCSQTSWRYPGSACVTLGKLFNIQRLFLCKEENIGFNFIGDGLRDALDPKQRR